LVSSKYINFLLFKEAQIIILNKQHLSYEGLSKILQLKDNINRGLSPILKQLISTLPSTPKPIKSCYNFQGIPNPM